MQPRKTWQTIDVNLKKNWSHKQRLMRKFFDLTTISGTELELRMHFLGARSLDKLWLIFPAEGLQRFGPIQVPSYSCSFRLQSSVNLSMPWNELRFLRQVWIKNCPLFLNICNVWIVTKAKLYFPCRNLLWLRKLEICLSIQIYRVNDRQESIE